MNELIIFSSGIVIGFTVLLVGIKTGIGIYYQIKEDMPEKQRPIEQEYTDFEDTK